MIKKFRFLAAIAFTIALVQSCAVSGEKPVKTEGDNPVVEAIMARRSIRKYTPQPVSREVMSKIVECGINAPSARNQQPWEVRIVDNAAYLKEINNLYNKTEGVEEGMFKDAPTVAFIAVDPTKPYPDFGCGLLVENMLLAAQSYGIGSVCLGIPIPFLTSDTAKPFIDKLGFSDGYKLILAVGFGHPDQSPSAKPRNAEQAKFVDNL
ncbi:MAG: nitroreductase [Rikenellaceae bacterium]